MQYFMGKVMRQLCSGEETGHEIATRRNQHTHIQTALISTCYLTKTANMSEHDHGFSMQLVEIGTLPFG